ncbi:hypothetical protein Bpfe_016461 [Biomphalaria pfeifferi]|uniref:Uncharacterized protein n=1 Tax=Biomphalaria pfeifferi TaxID=112525 RepID=A0AAD8BGM0_BIOPF|nr:hypothetical protein Bpfe_016461 [Biomphalaria pfeifferi]
MRILVDLQSRELLFRQIAPMHHGAISGAAPKVLMMYGGNEGVKPEGKNLEGGRDGFIRPMGVTRESGNYD